MDFQLGRIKNEYTIVVGKRGHWQIRSVRKANKIVSKDETDMFPEASSYEPHICKYKEGMTFKLPIEAQITNIPYKNSRDTLPIDPTTNLIYFYNSTTRRYEGYDKWNTEYISQSLYYPTTKHLFSGQIPRDSTDRPPANCNSVIIGHGPAIVL